MHLPARANADVFFHALKGGQLRTPWMVAIPAVAMFTGFALKHQARPAPHRLNPVIELLAQEQPVFGIYAPRNGRGGRGGVAPAAVAPPPKSAAQLAKDALAYANADFVFDGTMEGNFDAAFPAWAEFMKGMADNGFVAKAPSMRIHHPVFVKTHDIAENPALAAERIGRQLNEGASGIVFVGVESADEVRTGLAAMRFKSKGGTRPDNAGNAPAYWGLSESEYKEKADVWPLDPNGELTNWTIVESKEGLKHVREIAAVKGIAVLFPGAGTLRGVFTETVNGERRFDAAGWESAIQQVLAACKEFKVACGYPATANDIEERMKQGFSLFVMNWGDAGFRTIDIGKKAAGRTGERPQ
jgi:4-hydroxy-2-oxoheptanedioate aldolase